MHAMAGNATHARETKHSLAWPDPLSPMQALIG